MTRHDIDDTPITPELETRVRSALRAVADGTPLPDGLEGRLRQAVGGPDLRTDRLPGGHDRDRLPSPRRTWPPLAAAAAAAVLVIGSAAWWTLSQRRAEVAGPTGTSTVPWNATTMKPVTAPVDDSHGFSQDVPAGTPVCAAADLRVAFTRTTSDEPALLTTEVGVRSVADHACTVLDLGSVVPSGASRSPADMGGGGGPTKAPRLIPAGRLVHIVVWWRVTAGEQPPTTLDLTLDSDRSVTLPVDVGDLDRTDLTPTETPIGGASLAHRPYTWQLTSIAEPGSLASLTAELEVQEGGWFGAPAAGTMRVTNDTDTTVALTPCPDLLVHSDDVVFAVKTLVRGPLGCQSAPAALLPGQQVDIELMDRAGGSSSQSRPTGAQLVRGDDVVTARPLPPVRQLAPIPALTSTASPVVPSDGPG